MPAKNNLSKLLILFFLIWISTAAVGQEFSSLEERMTGQEFADTGLERLTEAELVKLNAWIRDHSLAQSEQSHGGLATVDGLGNSSDNADYYSGNPISSRLKGEFKGWDGTTVFELENGMIWVQDEKDSFSIKAITDPLVLVEPGMFSSWKLSVEGYNKKVRVERIQ